MIKPTPESQDTTDKNTTVINIASNGWCRSMQEELLAGIYFTAAFTAYNAGISDYIVVGLLIKACMDTMCAFIYAFKENKAEAAKRKAKAK